MKNMKIQTLLLAIPFLFTACSDDDPGSGGGGGETPINILANLYATSNSNSAVVAYDFTPNGILIRTMKSSSGDNQGVFYNEAEDELVVASRAQKVINTYSNIDNTIPGGDLNLFLSSDTVLESPRDIVVKDDVYIVSDSADVDGDPTTDDGRFFIFTRDANGYTLRNIVTVEFDVWGIELIEDDLYTVIDDTGDIAVFYDFIADYTTDVTVAPDKRITIEGIFRANGIAEDDGFVIITDIGDDANENDGSFHFISGFVDKFENTPNDGTLDFIGNQVKVTGHFTELGNPVGVDYDNQRRTIFIAERTNEGGKVLFFTEIGAGGNLVPTISSPYAGASSVYFDDK